MEHIKPQSGGKFTTDPEHGHEETDINVKSILGFGVFLLFSAVVIHVMLWGFYKALENNADKAYAGPLPVVKQMQDKAKAQSGAQPGADAGESGVESQKQIVERLKATFPTPRLQPDDVRDMKDLHANEEKVLNDYAWVDKSKGGVRIPVSRAMEIIEQRGLPNVPSVPAPGKGGTTTPAAKPAAKKL